MRRFSARTPLRALLLVAVFFFAATSSLFPAAAHEFWVQPSSYWTRPGDTTPATLMVSFGAGRERWAVGPQYVTRFDAHGTARTVDERPGLLPPGGREDAMLAFGEPGLHVVTLESRSSLSVLPAKRFNTYLEDEGLWPAIELRARQGNDNRRGRELYTRRAKTLVQVGPRRAQDARAATRRIGLTLEIVPERDPYGLAVGEDLPLRVFYDGRPLPGARVKLFSLDVAHKPLATQTTDAQGRVRFRLPRTGSWLLSTIWTKPIRDRRADFETTFASLTFGYPRGGVW